MAHQSSFSVERMRFTLDLPVWAVAELNQLPSHFPSLEARMAAVLKFAQLNFQQQTGGPFAAGIFERARAGWL